MLRFDGLGKAHKDRAQIISWRLSCLSDGVANTNLLVILPPTAIDTASVPRASHLASFG